MEFIEEYNPEVYPDQGNNNRAELKITKRQMRDKISSRQDFILIFGLECNANK